MTSILLILTITVHSRRGNRRGARCKPPALDFSLQARGIFSRKAGRMETLRRLANWGFSNFASGRQVDVVPTRRDNVTCWYESC